MSNTYIYDKEAKIFAKAVLKFRKLGLKATPKDIRAALRIAAKLHKDLDYMPKDMVAFTTEVVNNLLEDMGERYRELTAEEFIYYKEQLRKLRLKEDV